MGLLRQRGAGPGGGDASCDDEWMKSGTRRSHDEGTHTKEHGTNLGCPTWLDVPTSFSLEGLIQRLGRGVGILLIDK